MFVLLWSSSYIAFEFCSAHVEPATFIVIRTAVTAALLIAIVMSMKLQWPKRWLDVGHSVIVGILIHGIYAGGAFASIYHGIDLGLCALILSLQPLLTILLSSTFLGEKITLRKTFGVLAGFVGVSLLLVQGDGTSPTAAIGSATASVTKNSALSLFLCFIALMAISIGTIYQKRNCSKTEILPGAVIQFGAAAIFMLPFALSFETMQVNWSLSFILGLSWLVVFVSIGAMSLLMYLIRQGDAGSAANLFYLVTPLVAIQAWLLFDEPLTMLSLLGMVLCIAGVYVVNFASVIPRRSTPSQRTYHWQNYRRQGQAKKYKYNRTFKEHPPIVIENNQ
jgi:drug/metabolite transporter (DMT)-like permease